MSIQDQKQRGSALSIFLYQVVKITLIKNINIPKRDYNIQMQNNQILNYIIKFDEVEISFQMKFKNSRMK
ncbi:unnamed protein product [Paramecium octaurelia]|uniref:Uncharacterized protein n=1 Tax=Paramecium octaurelia TaxID=43137 RepID=A0A8S1X4Y1_PAROT|nr:unnamed protein product [Paramecium octaurelia]